VLSSFEELQKAVKVLLIKKMTAFFSGLDDKHRKHYENLKTLQLFISKDEAIETLVQAITDASNPGVSKVKNKKVAQNGGLKNEAKKLLFVSYLVLY